MLFLTQSFLDSSFTAICRDRSVLFQYFYLQKGGSLSTWWNTHKQYEYPWVWYGSTTTNRWILAWTWGPQSNTLPSGSLSGALDPRGAAQKSLNTLHDQYTSVQGSNAIYLSFGKELPLVSLNFESYKQLIISGQNGGWHRPGSSSCFPPSVLRIRLSTGNSISLPSGSVLRKGLYSARISPFIR